MLERQKEHLEKGIAMQARVVGLLIVVCIVFGCAARVEIDRMPPGSEDFLPSEVGILIPAIIRSTTLIINGQTITPQPEFLDLVLQKMTRTHVFSEVSFPLDSASMKMREKAVHLELQVTGRIRVNEFRNWTVGVLTLKFRDDFDVSMQLRAVRHDGEFKYYRTRIAGNSYYQFFGGENARRETEERVVEKSLNSLMRQIMEDIPFFAMEKSS